jgi:hypothetical protein
MDKDKIEMGGDTHVAEKIDGQLIEPKANQVVAPPAGAAERPWTEDFLLPSISFREPKQS